MKKGANFLITSSRHPIYLLLDSGVAAVVVFFCCKCKVMLKLLYTDFIFSKPPSKHTNIFPSERRKHMKILVFTLFVQIEVFILYIHHTTPLYFASLSLLIFSPSTSHFLHQVFTIKTCNC